jgi:hypothetical protein
MAAWPEHVLIRVSLSFTRCWDRLAAAVPDTNPETAAAASLEAQHTRNRQRTPHHTRGHMQATHMPKVSLLQAHLQFYKRVWCLLRCCRCLQGRCCARCACADLADLHVCAWAGQGESVALLFACRNAVLRVLDGGVLRCAGQPNSKRRQAEQKWLGWG